MTSADSARFRFTAPKKELAAALAWAAKGLPARPPVAILAGMRLEVREGTLTAAGFDYGMTARTSLAVDHTGSGVVLVRGHELVKALRGLPGAKGARVVAEVTGNALTVRAGGVTASAGLMPMDEYPELPEMPEQAGVMAAAEFTRAVGRVVPAAGTDETLPVLMGIGMAFAAHTVTLGTTDRYRAALAEVGWTGAELPDLAVPAKDLAMFARVADPDGKVTMHAPQPGGKRKRGESAGEVIVGFSDGTRELITRTLAGDFPKMARYFPSEVNGSADVDGQALAAAVTRAGKQADRNSPARLHVTRKGVTVTAYGDEGTVTYSETVPLADELDAPAGEDGRKVCGWRCAYNPAYLASMADAAGKAVRLSWGKLGAPVQISPADPADRFRALVMPIRTKV